MHRRLRRPKHPRPPTSSRSGWVYTREPPQTASPWSEASWNRSRLMNRSSCTSKLMWHTVFPDLCFVSLVYIAGRNMLPAEPSPLRLFCSRLARIYSLLLGPKPPSAVV
ncbi:hypothetical protein LY76DRAFT_34156 [Colletotrichum caudatum]|nr:hypothetical protein LY76DRAFT_34156 [Colletotrichum caudatum]